LQGGHAFASPAVAAALDVLQGEGALGRGQSSWGPTGFTFVPSAAEAERIVQIARNHPRCRGLDIRACKGLNRGAEISTEPAQATAAR
jgi:predicted sugar kinase